MAAGEDWTPHRRAGRHRHRRLARPRPRPRPRPRGARLEARRRRAGAEALERRRRRPRTVSSRFAGDVADPAHRRALVERRRRRASTCSSTTPASSGRARSRRSPTIRSTSSRGVYEVERPRAARRSSRWRCRGSRRAAADRQHHLGCRGRAVRGLGRLRLVEGRARAADGDPRRRAAASCASTPSTPATCGRRCTRRRSPARTSPTGRCPEESVPGLLELDRGHAAERPLPRPRSRDGGAGMTRCRAPRRASRRTSRRRCAARAATTSRSSSRAAATASSCTRASASCRGSSRAGDLLVVNTSATLAGGARRAARRRAGRSPPLDRARRRAWLVELRTATAAAPAPAGRSRLELDGGAARRAARTVRRQWAARDCAPRRSDVAARGVPLPCTAGRSATATSTSAGRSPRTRRCSRREPGSAEMPSAGRPFTAELVTRARRVAACSSRRSCCTPGVSSPERGEPPYPERYRVPATTARARQRRPRLGRPRDRGRHDGRPRARDASADDGRDRRPTGRGLDATSSSPPSAGCGPSTACSPGWHEPSRPTCRLLEAVAGAELARPLVPRRARARLPLARVRRRAPDPALSSPQRAQRLGPSPTATSRFCAAGRSYD